MSEFFQSIGLDWKLLLSQAVNFLILLVVLRFFAYKPILKVLKERRERIEEGITKAEEADHRLESITQLKKDKLQEAEQEGLTILRDSQEKAKQNEIAILASAQKKEVEILAKANQLAKVREKEAADEVKREAAFLIKSAIAKTVELDPSKIDDNLVQAALGKVTK